MLKAGRNWSSLLETAVLLGCDYFFIWWVVFGLGFFPLALLVLTLLNGGLGAAARVWISSMYTSDVKKKDWVWLCMHSFCFRKMVDSGCFLVSGWQSAAQIAQSSYVISLLGDTEKLSGRSPGLRWPGFSRGLFQMIYRGLQDLNHLWFNMILWKRSARAWLQIQFRD